MQRVVLLSLSLLFAFPISPAYARQKEVIPNLQVVSEGALYRGGELDAAGVQHLKKLGVKTIVSLEGKPEKLEAERKLAQAAGMSWFVVPMNALIEPEHWEVDSVLEILANPAMQPAYVHCKHGRDRTGMVVGIYRVEKDRWQPAHAYREMKQLGFRPILWGVRRYFEKRTGFDI